jgi:hypothetical protein
VSDYTPDKWLIVKITGGDYPPVHKVFACWYGGYLGSDSWKLNSGITKVFSEDDMYSFEGSSGSVYHCHKNAYGANGYGTGVLNRMIEDLKQKNVVIDILPEETNWMKLDYA